MSKLRLEGTQLLPEVGRVGQGGARWGSVGRHRDVSDAAEYEEIREDVSEGQLADRPHASKRCEHRG